MSTASNEDHRLQLWLNIMNNGLHLTELYIQLGQPREAFDYLMYSIDPTKGSWLCYRFLYGKWLCR